MDAESILQKIRQQARKRQAAFYLKHKDIWLFEEIPLCPFVRFVPYFQEIL